MHLQIQPKLTKILTKFGYQARLPSTRAYKIKLATVAWRPALCSPIFNSDFLSFAVGQNSIYKNAQKVNTGSYEHETCSKAQLIPYNFSAYQCLKFEVWTEVAPFLKSTHI